MSDRSTYTRLAAQAPAPSGVTMATDEVARQPRPTTPLVPMSVPSDNPGQVTPAPGVGAGDGFEVSADDLRNGYNRLHRTTEEITATAAACATMAQGVEPDAFGLIPESATAHAAFRDCASAVESKTYETSGKVHGLLSAIREVLDMYELNDAHGAGRVRRAGAGR